MGRQYFIDTSSWDALRKYFLPFDVEGETSLYTFLKGKIESGEFIVPYAVWRECNSQKSKGAKDKTLTQTFEFLSPPQNIEIDIKDIEERIDNEWRNKGKRKALSEEEYEGKRISISEQLTLS